MNAAPAPAPDREEPPDPEPTAGAAWRGWHGLYVYASGWDYHLRRWVRPPMARFTCRHGCHLQAVGFKPVRELLADLDERHALICRASPPGQ